MPKRTSTKKLDPVQNARRVVLESVEKTEMPNPNLISQVMSEMGRRGGLIGGKRRLETLSDERRSEIASIAAKKRWAKKAKRKK